MQKLEGKNAEVIGVSGDSAKNQQIFKAKEKLNFTLLADEDGSVAKKFGVPVSKGGEIKAKDADGKDVVLKRGVTIQRWTFVIDKDGKIALKRPAIKDAAGDSAKVLEAIEKLK